MAWQDDLFSSLKEAQIRQVSYVPDAGHARLIDCCLKDDAIEAVALTTEEEGVALAAGAWLGGDRSVVLMQSSGVGNCINMLSLNASCRVPLLMLVTMRGEFGEMNPWQIPMGAGTPSVLEAMQVRVLRVRKPDEVVPTFVAAATMAFEADQAVAILISQELLGAKRWVK